MLACSRQHYGQFALSAARLRVTVSDEECVVNFLDTCVMCALCADNCFYGALVKQEKDEAVL